MPQDTFFGVGTAVVRGSMHACMRFSLFVALAALEAFDLLKSYIMWAFGVELHATTDCCTTRMKTGPVDVYIDAYTLYP